MDVNVDGFEDMGIKEVEASADISQKPLVECFKSNPSVFHISQRKSKARMDLLTKTKMSNEQVEGWYTMLLRNPLKDLILQKYEFSGNQKQPRTAPSWKVAPDAGSSRQDGGDGSPSIRGSSPRGRGKVNRSNARLKKMSKGR